MQQGILTGAGRCRRRLRLGGALLGGAAAVLGGALSVTVPPPASAGALPEAGSALPPEQPVHAAGLTFTETWSRTLGPAGHPVGWSSPDVADLDGRPAVVVADLTGALHAFHLADGSPVPGWPASTGGVPVESTPSVADLGGGRDTVFVGVGGHGVAHRGGYEAFNPDGSRRWFRVPVNPAADGHPIVAVTASPTVSTLQGRTAVVDPSDGQVEYALDAASGAVLPGFPWFDSDSTFATDAVANLYGHGVDIVQGGDQTAGIAYGVRYRNGGHLRILRATGHLGNANPSSGLVCAYDADQVVQSSPAVGRFLPGGRTGIAFGTGTWWHGASQTDELLAVDTRCHLRWAARLDGSTGGSPALADLGGNGALDVVEGTVTPSGGGSVWAVDGAGRVLWHTPTLGAVIGGVATADLGGHHQDVLVASTEGLQVLDGRSGRVVATLLRWVGLQNTPLVTDDPDGRLGITVAGYDGRGTGVVDHFEILGSDGARADEAGAWPMFHHDPHLSGDAGTGYPS